MRTDRGRKAEAKLGRRAGYRRSGDYGHRAPHRGRQFTVGERNKVKLESDLQTRKDVVDFQRKLWLEKLDAYKSLVTLAGKIASSADRQAPATESGSKSAVDKPNIEDLWGELTAAYWGQKLF